MGRKINFENLNRVLSACLIILTVLMSGRYPGDQDSVWRRHISNKRCEEPVLYLYEQGWTAARQGNHFFPQVLFKPNPQSSTIGTIFAKHPFKKLNKKCQQERMLETKDCTVLILSCLFSFTEDLQWKLQLQGSFPRKLFQCLLLCKVD